jgi:hypothetical protein
MQGLASHLYKLEKEWVPKLILEVPLVLFSPKWIQYTCYDLRLLFDIFHLNRTLCVCEIIVSK